MLKDILREARRSPIGPWTVTKNRATYVLGYGFLTVPALAFLTSASGEGTFSGGIAGQHVFLASILVVLSFVAHEGGHAWAAVKRTDHSVTMYFDSIVPRVEVHGQQEPAERIVIAATGPAVSALFAAVFGALALVAPGQLTWVMAIGCAANLIQLANALPTAVAFAVIAAVTPLISEWVSNTAALLTAVFAVFMGVALRHGVATDGDQALTAYRHLRDNKPRAEVIKDLVVVVVDGSEREGASAEEVG